tara:strand:- start:382 stop:522 length:141 start_codon:yes stop_codon:yes gene_type:complete
MIEKALAEVPTKRPINAAARILENVVMNNDGAAFRSPRSYSLSLRK